MHKVLYHFTNTKFDKIDLDVPHLPENHPNSMLGLWCFTDIIDSPECASFADVFRRNSKHLLRIELKHRAVWVTNDISDWHDYSKKYDDPLIYVKMRDFLVARKQDVFGVAEHQGESVTCCLLNPNAVRVLTWVR